MDIVPNHVGVDDPTQNPWWWDVLRERPGSAYAHYFDIDWDAGPDGRIVLPVLGSDDDVDALEVDGDVLRLGDQTFPIAPGTGAGTGAEVHDRQHYRLIGWRSDVCGYRRFFVDHLAGRAAAGGSGGLRRHPRRGAALVRRGLVDGIRIDHPDGLSDPAGYLARLRELAGAATRGS